MPDPKLLPSVATCSQDKRDAKRMKLEVGKSYKTRNGKTALVAAIDEAMTPGEQALGWVETMSCSWTTAGSFYADLAPHGLDLTEELSGPRRIKGWVNIYEAENGAFNTSAGFADRQQADRMALGPRLACVEIDVLEGHGLGTETAK